MKILKRLFQILAILVAVFLLYILIVIVHGTITDYQPKEKIVLKVEGAATQETVTDSVLSFINWNIGYGGLGEESNFFYDDGRMLLSGEKMVRASKKVVEKNINAFTNFVEVSPADFYLFQEVDIASKRSYYMNEYKTIGEELEGFASSFAMNYKVGRVPLPVGEFWNVMGQMKSGLATYTKYQPIETVRYQFPGNYSWPMRIFQLDRCFALHRFKVKNGKELVVINTHNSAYDEGGKLKKQQTAYLKNTLLQEYKKGNYVVVGGDWNQCPPNFDNQTLSPNKKADWSPLNIDADYLPADWLWVYDPVTPTNRSLVDTYKAGETPTNLIDFYVISPNLEVIQIKTFNQEFQFSDHQPVYLKVKLKK